MSCGGSLRTASSPHLYRHCQFGSEPEKVTCDGCLSENSRPESKAIRHCETAIYQLGQVRLFVSRLLEDWPPPLGVCACESLYELCGRKHEEINGSPNSFDLDSELVWRNITTEHTTARIAVDLRGDQRCPGSTGGLRFDVCLQSKMVVSVYVRMDLVAYAACSCPKLLRQGQHKFQLLSLVETSSAFTA